MSSLLFRGAAIGGHVDNLQVILVVEDDHLIQSVVEESLTDGGFEIVIASSGQNALELLDARPKENIERSSPTSI
jgi:ActR/RegA family two-component response regulator